MRREIKGNMGPSLGLNNSRDLYKKLRHDSARLRSDWNKYDAFNFILTAWHLHHDWHRSDPNNDISRNKRTKSGKLPQEMKLAIAVTQDIANGSKHFILDPKPAMNRRVSTTHQGLESSWYSYFFHENTFGVTTNDGHYFSIRVLHNILMAYFEWVFDDNASPRQFPAEIVSAIKYCNIAGRLPEDEMPRLWTL